MRAPRAAPLVLGALIAVLTGGAAWVILRDGRGAWREALSAEEHRLARVLAREAAVDIFEARFAFVDSFLATALEPDADSASLSDACLRFLRSVPGVASIALFDTEGTPRAGIARQDRELVPLEEPLPPALTTACRQAIELLEGESFALRCDRHAVDALDRPSNSDPHLVFAAPLHGGRDAAAEPRGCAVGVLDVGRLDRFFTRSLWSDPRRSVGLYDRDGQLLLGVAPLPEPVRALSLELPSGVCADSDAMFAFAWVPLPQNLSFPTRLDDAAPSVPKRGRPGKDWLLVVRHVLAGGEGELSDERARVSGRSREAYAALALAALLALGWGLGTAWRPRATPRSGSGGS